MNEKLQSSHNSKKPSIIRQALVFGLAGISATACGLPRAEYDASTKELHGCDAGTPLSQKSRPIADGDALIADVTKNVIELHERATTARGEVRIDLDDQDRPIDGNTHFYAFSATDEELLLAFGQDEGDTVDKVVFPFENGEPKAITLGALACSEDTIYQKQIVDYIEAGLEATKALDVTPS